MLYNYYVFIILVHSSALWIAPDIQRPENHLKLLSRFHSPLRTQFPGDLNPAGGFCATRFSSAAAQGALRCIKEQNTATNKSDTTAKGAQWVAAAKGYTQLHAEVVGIIKSEWRREKETRVREMNRVGGAESECNDAGVSAERSRASCCLRLHLARAGCDIVALSVCTHLWRAKVKRPPACLIKRILIQKSLFLFCSSRFCLWCVRKAKQTRPWWNCKWQIYNEASCNRICAKFS